MRAIRWLLLLMLVLLLLAAAALALFPARLAVDWFGDRLGPLQLEEVGGTIWNGRAQRASFNGQPLGVVGWRIAPQSLLGRRVDADLSLDGETLQATGFVSARRDLVLLTNTRLSLPAQRMQPALDIPALTLRGTVDVTLDRAELVAGFPRLLEGSAVWRDAAVDGAAAAELGELHSEFRTGADGALVGTVGDRGGPLAVDGHFRLDFTGFEAEAVLAARDGNPQVIEALRHVGEPQPDGSSLLLIKGRLLPTGR